MGIFFSWGCDTPLFDLLGCDAHLLAWRSEAPDPRGWVVANYSGGGDHGALAPVIINDGFRRKRSFVFFDEIQLRKALNSDFFQFSKTSVCTPSRVEKTACVAFYGLKANRLVFTTAIFTSKKKSIFSRPVFFILSSHKISRNSCFNFHEKNLTISQH